MTSEQAHHPSPAISAALLATKAQVQRGGGGRPIASAIASAFQIASKSAA